jgi:hypothetical protein
MHFNSLHLPTYLTWGTSDNSWNAEWFAYGRPAQAFDELRRACGADTTVAYCSGVDGHGHVTIPQDTVCEWLSHFRLNRFPNSISINADESDEYYWTRVELADTNHVFGRYGVERDSANRRLDITLVRNISRIDIECEFPWCRWDSLVGHWAQLDSVDQERVTVRLCGVPEVTGVTTSDGHDARFAYGHDTLTVFIHGANDYVVRFDLAAPDVQAPVPQRLRLVSAYPNPFNGAISLEIESPAATSRELVIYDLMGRIALTKLVSLSVGSQRVTVTADGLPSGIYFATLRGSSAAPLKIVLLK